MYCLQGNLRPFLKPFSIFCHWENKTHLKKKHPSPQKKIQQQQKNLKEQKS